MPFYRYGDCVIYADASGSVAYSIGDEERFEALKVSPKSLTLLRQSASFLDVQLPNLQTLNLGVKGYNVFVHDLSQATLQVVHKERRLVFSRIEEDRAKPFIKPYRTDIHLFRRVFGRGMIAVFSLTYPHPQGSQFYVERDGNVPEEISPLSPFVTKKSGKYRWVGAELLREEKLPAKFDEALVDFVATA